MTSSTSQSMLHTKKKISSSEEGENVLYSKSILTQKVQLPFIIVGSNVETTIKHTISTKIEGKCIVEGYVKPGSIRIINISSGTLQGRFVEFVVVFECSICCPVEGMLIKCYAKNITQAGIRAFTNVDEKKSPVIIYVSRDHHSSDSHFNSIHEKDAIRIRVIGQRFELNDKQVSIIGELLPKVHAPQSNEPLRKKIIIKPNKPSSSSSSSS
jgi:DNA-directed RNA polymerase subunit E'/Rpb7